MSEKDLIKFLKDILESYEREEGSKLYYTSRHAKQNLAREDYKNVLFSNQCTLCILSSSTVPVDHSSKEVSVEEALELMLEEFNGIFIHKGPFDNDGEQLSQYNPR